MRLDRRDFIKTSMMGSALFVTQAYDDFLQGEPVSLEKGGNQSVDVGFGTEAWESLNPGYWTRTDEGIRRTLDTVGDRARQTGFPFHYETHLIEDEDTPEGVMDVNYDPSLPLGMMWNRQWRLQDAYKVGIEGTVLKTLEETEVKGNSDWKKYQRGNGVIGIAIGGKSQWDGFHSHENAPLMLTLDDTYRFGVTRHTAWSLEEGSEDGLVPIDDLGTGDRFAITATVRDDADGTARIKTELAVNGTTVATTHHTTGRPAADVAGYFGIVSRGLLQVELSHVMLQPRDNQRLDAPLNECHTCYPLGDTLRREDGTWTVTFVSIFRGDGDTAAVKVATEPEPDGGWGEVSASGTGTIRSNDFRENTAIIEVTLPENPAETTHYFTVWKDGVDVTSDPRIGTDSCGSGTGFVGDVPSSGTYAGRLPQLTAPYRICGLSCHAIHENNTSLPDSEPGEGFYVHDQPRYGAFEHLEDYDFQVLLWEDDIWYLELLLYPPSTESAYKIITTTLCGPTARWKMMRHWNVLNPGDHDHGMDDVKGPEQIVLRNHDNLGQDPEYMARNFQIVSHLMTGAKDPDGHNNPKRWRKWRMPDRDFTLMIMDARLWRTSQDTDIWDDEGWGHVEGLYDRKNPTRALLGEEQFAWLQETLHTEPANLICLSGINGLHTVWAGQPYGREQPWPEFAQWDRVAADYAGWVGAGADRVLELLGGRTGVSTVCGDVHNGSILRNKTQNVYECSFGPIGRYGGRMVIDGFGPEMTDVDGRAVEALALYHEDYQNVQLEERTGEPYWNFLEMEFDPARRDPTMQFAIRNIVDPPSATPRGGGAVEVAASSTGRTPSSRAPSLQTLPDADVRFTTLDGAPVRGCHALDDGTLPHVQFPDVEPGTRLLMVAEDGADAEARIVRTTEL
ncbi:MAG: hypothetical protein V5A48_01260 [Salinivenus sp.]